MFPVEILDFFIILFSIHTYSTYIHIKIIKALLGRFFEMGKTHTTLSIDEDYRRQAREMGLNLSETLNDALTLRFAQITGNSAKISEEIEKKRLKKAQKELEKWQFEAKNAQKNLEILQKSLEEAKEKELLDQKAAIEELKTCINCKNQTQEERLIHFPAGLICKGCYLIASGEDIKKWNKAGA